MASPLPLSNRLEILFKPIPSNTCTPAYACSVPARWGLLKIRRIHSHHMADTAQTSQGIVKTEN